MDFCINAASDMQVPLVTINGERLSVVRFEMCYETKTDEPNSGKYFATVSGYLPNSDKLSVYKLGLVV